MKEMKRWSRIAPGLYMAVGLRFPLGKEVPELINHPPPAGAAYQIYYFSLPDDWRSGEIITSLLGQETDRGELRFRRRVGHRVLFGRAGEKGPFGFTTGEYVTLRLNPEDRTEEPYKYFNPLFIRIDKGTEVHFCLVEALWVFSAIHVSVEELKSDDERIPDFLTNLPEHLRVGENAYLLLD